MVQPLLRSTQRHDHGHSVENRHLDGNCITDLIDCRCRGQQVAERAFMLVVITVMRLIDQHDVLTMAGVAGRSIRSAAQCRQEILRQVLRTKLEPQAATTGRRHVSHRDSSAQQYR